MEEARIEGTGAMVDEPDDRRDSASGKRFHLFIDPCPSSAVRRSLGHTLPENRVADRAHAKIGEAIDVSASRIVPEQVELIVLNLSDAIERALEPRPELE